MNSNDGTTSIQVAPIPTESEMASIRQIFTNVANALVRASELAKQVTELELRFAQLNEDHTRVMARSDQLEQSLSETRTQRDEALSNLSELKSSFNNLTSELDKVVADGKAKAEQIDKLHAEVDSVKAESDGYFNAWHKAEAELTETRAALAKIKSALGIVDPPKPIGPVTDPTPTQFGQAEPIPEVRPLSEAEANAPKPEPEKYEPTTWDPNKF